jgi:hypothetical protein
VFSTIFTRILITLGANARRLSRVGYYVVLELSAKDIVCNPRDINDHMFVPFPFIINIMLSVAISCFTIDFHAVSQHKNVFGIF